MNPSPPTASSAFDESDSLISGWAEQSLTPGPAQQLSTQPVHTVGVLGLLGWQGPEFRAAIATGLAYAVLAAVALWVSAPEVYTGLWLPAAGLALAATFRRGIAALLGVAAAAFAVQAIWADWRGLGPDMSVALPLCLAVAATVQAGLGAGLVQRLVQRPVQPGQLLPETRPAALRQTVLAALLAGPVACLLGASIASLALWNFGVVQTASLWATVFSIWLGNTLSVWLVAPLVLHCWPRQPPHALADSTQQGSSLSGLMLSVPLSLLVLSLALAVLGLQQRDRQQQQRLLEGHSLGLADQLSRQLEQPWFALQAMGAIAAAAGPTALLTEAASVGVGVGVDGDPGVGVGKHTALNASLLPSVPDQGLVSAGLLWANMADEADHPAQKNTLQSIAQWVWPLRAATQAASQAAFQAASQADAQPTIQPLTQPAPQSTAANLKILDRRLRSLLQQPPGLKEEGSQPRLWPGAMLAGLGQTEEGLISLVKPVWRQRSTGPSPDRPSSLAPPDGVLWLTIKVAPPAALPHRWWWCLHTDNASGANGANGAATGPGQTRLAGTADCDRKAVFDNRSRPASVSTSANTSASPPAGTLGAWAAAAGPQASVRLLRPLTEMHAPLRLELWSAPNPQPLLHNAGRRTGAAALGLFCVWVAGLLWALHLPGRRLAGGATGAAAAEPQPSHQNQSSEPQPDAAHAASKALPALSLPDTQATRPDEASRPPSPPAPGRPSKSMLDLLPWGLLWLDRQGWLLSCNPQSCQRLGLQAEMLVGSQLKDWLSPEGASQVRRWYADHRRQPGAASHWQSIRIGLPAGLNLCVDFQARALRDDRGRVQGFAVLLERSAAAPSDSGPLAESQPMVPAIATKATKAQEASQVPEAPEATGSAEPAEHIVNAALVAPPQTRAFEPKPGPSPERLCLHSIGNHPALLKHLPGVAATRPDWLLTMSTLGLDGLAAVRMRRPDLLLLDIRLPDIDGLELLRHIRRDADLVDLPLVVLTHDQNPELIGQALELGASQCVSPPLDSAGFVDLVEQALQAESVV